MIRRTTVAAPSEFLDTLRAEADRRAVALTAVLAEAVEGKVTASGAVAGRASGWSGAAAAPRARDAWLASLSRTLPGSRGAPCL